MSPLHHLLYTSVIAPTASPARVADILRQARANNEARAITGLLVFDGWRFCQYLEGAEADILDLKPRIAGDRRHHRLQLLHQGPFPGPRLFPAWSMGYALAPDDALLEALERQRGILAVERLQAMLPLLDMAP